MGITELNHINIRTTKMEETKDFFIDIVGLEIGWRPDFDSHGYWMYCGDVPIVHLSGSDPDSKPRTDHAGRGNGLDHIGLFAKDLSGMEKTLVDKNITYRTCLASGGKLIQVFFLDPNGVQVELGYDADLEGVTPDNFRAVDAPGLGI